MAVDWSELPIDIIQLIFERLIHISDHNQFSLVCSSWRSLALQHRRRCFPPDIPGLLIPGQNCNTSCQTRRFLPSPIGKEIIDQTIHVQNNEQLFLPLLPIPHENLCRGSYEDWLVMVEKNMSMYLLNPFSGTRIDLPPVNALPRPPMFVARPKSKWYINKVILSARPSSSSSSSSSSTEDKDCIVMVFYRDNDLAFCKLGEKKVWRVFNDCAEEFDDGIFYKKSFVFVDPCGEVFICNDIETMQPQITFLAGTPPRIFPPSSKWYLVESSAEGGDLLLIYKGSYHERDNDEQCSNRVVDVPREQSDSENDDVDEFDYDNEYKGSKAAVVQKTTTFIIFKLDTTSGSTSPTWVEVKNLDGEALFLGLNQSFSLSESHIQAYHAAGYRSNRIYFSDDDIIGHKLRLISGNNMGIFNLEDSTIEPLYLIDSDSTKPPAVWLTPKPWSWSKSYSD